MANSVAIVENMAKAYVFIVVLNIFVSFRVLDVFVSVFSRWGIFSNFVAAFFKYQQVMDRALRSTSHSIPVVSIVLQLLNYSLQVYMKRISEITLVCIAPTILFNAKGLY